MMPDRTLAVNRSRGPSGRSVYHCDPVGSFKRAATVLEPFLSAGVLFGLAWSAPAKLLPGLGIVRGPLGWVLLALGAALTVGRRVPVRAWLRSPPRNWVLFLAAVALNLGLGLHYAANLRVSGDEPHYLLMAQSLWREGDLDLQDNLAREDYREYTPGPITPHFGAPRRDGRPFPAHSPGLPLLLAPIYAASGRLGCVAFLGLLAAWLAVEVRVLGRSLLGPGPDLVAWLVTAGPPVLLYAFHVYTEVPTALALALALRLLLLGPAGPAGAAAAGLAASTLPWLHVKMIPAAAALGVLALARLRGRPRAVFLGVSGVAAFAFLVHYGLVFGTPLPTAIYGGVPADFRFRTPFRALVGLILDRSFGLLPYAPIFLLGLAGIPALCRRKLWPVLWVALSVLVPLLTWRMWWGGQCPPGRFLVPLVPFLALAAGACVADSSRGLVRWRAPLAVMGLTLAVFMAARPGALLLLNRGDRPTRVWTALSGDVAVGRYLPSLVSADPTETRTAVVWLAFLAALLALHGAARKRERVDSLFGVLILPLALLIAGIALVDFWARPLGGSQQPPAMSDPPSARDGAAGSPTDSLQLFSCGNDRRVAKRVRTTQRLAERGPQAS